jgi:multimeric flavodoxin WrbA
MKVIITDIAGFDFPVSGDHQIVSPDTGNGNIKNCIGCFGCWHKTPGECVIHDGYQRTGAKLGHCDQLIFVSECVYGSLSPFCKMVLDRSISYVHPNFVTRRGEMHHKRRYDNVITVTAYLYGGNLTEEEKAWFDENIGLVEASIGRMVPVQTEEMKDGEPMRVCVESYDFLPTDKDAFKGGIPEIRNMVPFSPFDFYLKRKLYIHNMGHATCAYLGDLYGLSYIYEAIDRDDIYIVVKNAMEQSAQALSKKYGVALETILPHIDDLLFRFTNRALQDTCQRVGGDPKRKLSAEDRLIGSGKLAFEMGITPAYIAIGAAAALKRYLTENDLPQSGENARNVLKEVSELSECHPLFALVAEAYDDLIAGASISALRRKADGIVAAGRKII